MCLAESFVPFREDARALAAPHKQSVIMLALLRHFSHNPLAVDGMNAYVWEQKKTYVCLCVYLFHPLAMIVLPTKSSILEGFGADR